MALPRNTVEVKVNLQIENKAFSSSDLSWFTEQLNEFFKCEWAIQSITIDTEHDDYFALLYRNKPKDEST